MKLGLGTVQFGLDYGITNTSGRTAPEEVRAILAHAMAHGVELLDTAALYGDSEAVLGIALPRPHNFHIISKTLSPPPTQSLGQAIGFIYDGIQRSLDRLGETCLSGLLVHRADDLLGPHGDHIFETLLAFRENGVTEKIGVSVYTPQEAQTLLQRYSINLIQLPLNPLDQRHLNGGSLAALVESGVEIHTRSAFLQGLLLAPQAPLPLGLTELSPVMERWRLLLAELELKPLHACLGFLRGISTVDAVICGATNLSEWQQIVAANETAPTLPTEIFKKLAVLDDNLVDARYWPKR